MWSLWNKVVIKAFAAGHIDKITGVVQHLEEELQQVQQMRKDDLKLYRAEIAALRRELDAARVVSSGELIEA